jgi:hypothetical protein
MKNKAEISGEQQTILTQHFKRQLQCMRKIIEQLKINRCYYQNSLHAWKHIGCFTVSLLHTYIHIYTYIHSFIRPFIPQSFFRQVHISKLSRYFWSTFRSVQFSAKCKATLQTQRFIASFLKLLVRFADERTFFCMLLSPRRSWI